MEYQLYKNIISNPDICNGKPTLKGTRITVKAVMRLVHIKEKDKKILKDFPRMTATDLQVCKEFYTMFLANPSTMKTIKA